MVEEKIKQHVVESVRYDGKQYDDTLSHVQYTHSPTEKMYKTIHQPVTPFTFTLIMRVTAELIYTHINDLIWSFVKEKRERESEQKKQQQEKRDDDEQFYYYIIMNVPLCFRLQLFLFGYKRVRNALSIIVSHHSNGIACTDIDGNSGNNNTHTIYRQHRWRRRQSFPSFVNHINNL